MRKALFIPGIFVALTYQASMADVTLIEPTPVQGQISQVVYSPDGRPEGVVLKDHTLLEFPVQSLADPNALAAGDQISAEGILVLTSPNRVFNQVSLRKGGTQLFDNSQAQTVPMSVIPRENTSTFKTMTRASPLLAVGASPDGHVDRLILQDGTDAQIPWGGYIAAKKLHLGEPIQVTGSGIRFLTGAFVHTLTAQLVGGPWLLEARGDHGEEWMTKEGSVKQALLTPHGQIEGVLMTDNSAIRFPPISSDQAYQFTSGVQVKAAGPGFGNSLQTDSVILTRGDRFISFAPPITSGTVRQLAGQAPFSELMPMKDTSRVEAVISDSQDRPEIAVLSDGVTVSIPPGLRSNLDLKPGKSAIAVKGEGGTYAMGIALQAEAIQLATVS